MPQTRTARLESLDSLIACAETRRVARRLASVARQGRLGDFAELVLADGALDQGTKRWVLDLAADAAFLHAVELSLADVRHAN